MSDEPHTIPDHVAARAARLINEAEDMRQQGADALKEIYSELRDELRGMGWLGSVVAAEVAALKGAIAEIRLDDEKKAKREEKGERIGDYVSLLSRARAREATSYAEAKGVETNSPATANVTPGADIRAAGRGVHSMHPLQDQPETAHGTNPSDGSVNPHGEPVAVAANMENDHVDSSAERASSAVEFGATNSPERANEFSDWHSRQAEPGANASKGVTGGESAATNSHSLPTSSQVADTADSVAPPALSAPNSDDVPAFLREPVNERCLNQGACKYARNPHKVTCSDCGSAFMKKRAVPA